MPRIKHHHAFVSLGYQRYPVGTCRCGAQSLMTEDARGLVMYPVSWVRLVKPAPRPFSETYLEDHA